MKTRICKKCNSAFQNRNNSKYCESCRVEKRTCAICGQGYITRPSLKKVVMTCSKECGTKYQSRNTLSNRAKNRPPCSNCGVPIVRRFINYGKRKGKNLFCNKVCMGEWQSKNRINENHPRWKGGTYGYYGNTWRKQRAAARDRDKFCQRCGKTPKDNGKALDVHHAIPFREFGVERQSEAHNLNNLISLCVSCHQLEEWK